MENKKAVDVYIIAGQSNALGLSPISQYLKRTCVFNNVDIYLNSNVTHWWNDSMIRMQAGLGQTDEMFGMELGIALSLEKVYSEDKRALIVKYASDGTSLYDRWKPPFGEDYVGLMKTIKSALKQLFEDNKEANIKGFFWTHGESDGHYLEQACSYENNLIAFIQSVRQELCSPIRFILSQINPINTSIKYRQIVISAQKNIALTLPSVFFVDTSDLTELIDSYHYTAICELQISKRMAEVLLSCKE